MDLMSCELLCTSGDHLPSDSDKSADGHVFSISELRLRFTSCSVLQSRCLTLMLISCDNEELEFCYIRGIFF